MSELRPATPARRPETARPREDAEVTVEPPSPDDLARIERHLASLPLHSGAEVLDDPNLGVVLVRALGAGIGLNYGALPRWSAEGWRAALDRLAAKMRSAGEWPSLLVADRLDRPLGLAGQLPSAGWSAAGRETVMWVGHASIVPHLDASLRIEAVRPGDVADHEALEGRVFRLPKKEAADRRQRLSAALERGGLRAYVVRVGGEPVAVARLSQGDGVSGLYGIGVSDAWRRKGMGTLITTVATRAGLVTGNRLVWLSVEDGNDGARAMYEKLGFRPAFGWSRWLSASR